MGEGVAEERQRYTPRLQAGKDLRQAMTKLIIDGKEIDVSPEFTLLQACEAAGAEIPRFLLPPAAVDRRQLPDVPGGDQGRPENRSRAVPGACAIAGPVPRGNRRKFSRVRRW